MTYTAPVVPAETVSDMVIDQYAEWGDFDDDWQKDAHLMAVELLARRKAERESHDLAKRVCYAPGDKCEGCDHYYGKAKDCKYKAKREAVPVAWMYEHDGEVYDEKHQPIISTYRWHESLRCEPWTETPLYTHAAPPDGMVLVPEEIIDRFPEINPSNYDHDDACALNAWGVEVVLSARPKIN